MDRRGGQPEEANRPHAGENAGADGAFVFGGRVRSVLAPGLIEAYRRARYSFEEDGREVPFHIGEVSSAIARRVSACGGEGAVCVTAYNPLGEATEEEANRAASARLRGEIERRNRPFLAAKGEDPGGGWDAEPGYMVFGLRWAEAELLGNRFRQNAVVWVDRAGRPELRLLR